MNEKFQKTLSRFIKFCRENHVPQALLKGVPYIGDSVNEILFEANADKLALELSVKLFEQQALIIKEINEFKENYLAEKRVSDAIVAIGGGTRNIFTDQRAM